MKLTYEQMRRLSDIDEGGHLTIKDKKGHLVKKGLQKCHPSPMEAQRSQCSLTPHLLSHALMESRSQTSLRTGSSQRLVGKERAKFS